MHIKPGLKLILVLIIFGLAAYLFLINISKIDLYNISTVENGIAYVEFSDELGQKDSAFFEDRIVRVEVFKDKSYTGKITKSYSTNKTVKFSGNFGNKGEFRFAIEDNVLSGSIFVNEDIYIVTSENDNTILKQITASKDQDIAKTDNKIQIESEKEKETQVKKDVITPENNIDNTLAVNTNTYSENQVIANNSGTNSQNTTTNQETNNDSSEVDESNNTEVEENETEEPIPNASKDSDNEGVNNEIPPVNPNQEDLVNAALLKQVKDAEVALENVYDDSNTLSTTYPESIVEVIKEIDTEEEPAAYIYVPSEVQLEENTFAVELPVIGNLEVTKDESYDDLTTFSNYTDEYNNSFLGFEDGELTGQIVKEGVPYEVIATDISNVHKLVEVEYPFVEGQKMDNDAIVLTDAELNSATTQSINPRNSGAGKLEDVSTARTSNSDIINTADYSSGYNPVDIAYLDGIDIVVIYTDEAFSLASSSYALMNTRIYNNIDSANRVFQNNQIDARLDLVGTARYYDFEEADYDRNAHKIITAIKDDPEVEAYRLLKKADLVMFISGNVVGNVCGTAWLGGVEELWSDWAFALTVGTAGCMATSWGTFTHEVGHNLGLNHDRQNAFEWGPLSAYNYGYTDRSSFRSVMSYENTCTRSCPMIEYFSDSIRRFRDRAIGNAANDNARVARYTTQMVANYVNSENGNLLSDTNNYYPTTPHIPQSPLTNSTIYTPNVEMKWRGRKIYIYNPETGFYQNTAPTAYLITLRDDYGFTKYIIKQYSEVCIENVSAYGDCKYTIDVPNAGTFYWYIQGLDYMGKNTIYRPWALEQKFNVSFALPEAGFHAEGPTEGYNQLFVQFKNDSLYAYEYEWSIDGVIVSDTRDTFYNFGRGIHTVTLKVRNGNGEDIETKTNYINVKDPVIDGQILGRNIEVADFRSTTVYAKRNGTFEFKVEDKSLSTTINSWSWDLNNDGSIESTDPIFNTGNLLVGKYNLKLIISDGEFNKEIIQTAIINVVSGEVDGIGTFNGTTLIVTGPERTDNDPLNKRYTFTGLPSNTAYNTVFTGDFDGDGMDTFGVFDPKTGEWYITNNLAGGVFEIRFNKVAPLTNNNWADMIAVAGDFDGDGKDSVGIFVKGRWYISNTLNGADWEIVESYGVGPLADGPFKPLVGDWNRDGKDTLGYFSQNLPRIRLSNDSVENTDINSSNQLRIAHSISSSQWNVPYAGDFNGDGRDDYALVTSSGTFRVWPVGTNADNYYINFGGPGNQRIVGNW